MKKTGVRLGLQAGLLIGLVYVLLLWIKFTFLSFSPFAFYLGSFVSYFLVLACLSVMAHRYRQKLGGYAEIRTLFQPLFIAVIVMELFYVLFTYLYLNYVNPTFFDQFYIATENFVKSRNMDPERGKNQLQIVRDQATASKSLWGLLKSILPRWIVIDSIFALMIALVLRKKSPDELMNQYLGKQKF